jgi:TPR repeat protein
LSAFTRADEQGYALGTYNLAAMYKGGQGVPPDQDKANSLLEKATRGGAAASVVRSLEKAAADGDSEAMDLLGRIYFEGWGVSKDPSKGFELKTKAAEIRKKAAEVSIQLRAAVERARPKIVEINVTPYDRELASLVIKSAAEAGDVYAMALTGWMYAEGRGVSQDYVLALEWYKKAATHRHAMSMVAVGRFYHYGCGVTLDAAEARRWYDMTSTTSSALASKVAAQSRALLDRPDVYRSLISQPQADRCLPPMSAPN